MPKCELTFNYSVTELSNVDVWDGNGLYILYQTAENRQNSHLSTHLHISTNKTGFFFSPSGKKKRCVSFETLYWKEISCNYSSEQLQILELHLFCKKSKTPDSVIWVLASLMHGLCLYSVLAVSSLTSDYHL